MEVKGYLTKVSTWQVPKNKNFKREFYWDLWQDLDNLRAEATAVTTVATYLERAYLESKGIQRKRAQSFDTQT